jgi:hypothetical protein
VVLLLGLVSCAGSGRGYQLRPSHPKAFRVREVLENAKIKSFRHDQNSVNLILLDIAGNTYLKKTLLGYPLVIRISPKSGNRRLTIRRTDINVTEALDDVCRRANLVWRIEPSRIAVYDRDSVPKE